MKKARILLSVLLSIALLLAGCAASPAAQPPAASMAAAATAEAQTDSRVQPAPGAPEGAVEEGQNGSAMPILDPGNAAQSGKKIVYTVQMTLEAPDAAAAIDDITNRAIALGGYVSQSGFMRSSDYQNGSITVRIPPEKLREFTEQLRAGYKALNSDMSSQDVTDAYVDLQSRLTNAQAQEAQLLGIMKQAVKVDDILTVRKELNQVQQEIEQLKGQLRLIDNQVGYSTVTITVQEPPMAPQVKTDEGVVRFLGLEYTWGSIRKGFGNGLNFTLNAISQIIIVFSTLFMPLLAVAIMVFVIILIVRLAGRSKKKT